MEKDFTTNSKLSLKNKNILITGAGKGTGYELLKLEALRYQHLIKCKAKKIRKKKNLQFSLWETILRVHQ